MGLFSKGNLPIEEVKQLRGQGLSDNQVIEELQGNGFSLPQINDALAQSGMAGPESDFQMPQEQQETMSPEPMMESAPAESMGEDLYGRIEEIAEGIIDEKWDLLVDEVKKIAEWKDKVEGIISRLDGDVNKLKEDFKLLHQGVLGKLESYDSKMTEVGTELKAVGKVFKDVIPEFVENVKELKSISKGVKRK